MSDNKIRCEWSTVHQIDQDYHDEEWGVPVYDDRKLFEMLCLEGQQVRFRFMLRQHPHALESHPGLHLGSSKGANPDLLHRIWSASRCSS